MSRRARSLALGAIALLGVLGAWLAFAPSAAERDEPRDRETAERSSARAEAPDGDVARSAATATDLAAARARAESARRARRPLELLSIHGRLVLANGGVPRNGVVWLRGAGERLDFHDLFERLGGPAEWQRLTNSQELESRVRALGGFTPSWRAEAREDGSFDLHVPARAARFTFGAEADGAAYARAEAFDLSPARRDAPYVVVLDEAGALEGTVRDASGEAARHAWIALWPNGARLAGRVDFVERMRAEGDASGRFRFSALPPGSYQFAATADGCAPSSYDTVEVVAGAIARADIALPAGHEVSGRVTRGDGAPVEGALIRAWPSRGWVMLEAYGCARTDAQGRFRLGGLLPGPHSIDASREGLVTRKTEDTDAVAIPRPADAPPLAFVL
ncbi:MAG TPA: carboxypeptidase-like regulatory domain-containing protein, partial [Planctomycetota bacterium]|nr:carboxypeptidase-like regulatory domain-containing protein [Planctomycetota bacterium]